MEVGKHFMYEGNEFVCNEYDGFILRAYNVDSSSNLSCIMWVGRIDERMEEETFKLL